jgi:hypothetical protein
MPVSAKLLPAFTDRGCRQSSFLFHGFSKKEQISPSGNASKLIIAGTVTILIKVIRGLPRYPTSRHQDIALSYPPHPAVREMWIEYRRAQSSAA